MYTRDLTSHFPVLFAVTPKPRPTARKSGVWYEMMDWNVVLTPKTEVLHGRVPAESVVGFVAILNRDHSSTRIMRVGR